MALPVLAAGAALWSPAPAAAAPPTIYAYTYSGGAYGTSNYWSPSTTQAVVGDTQTWMYYSGTSHGLQPLGTGSPWPAGCTGGPLTATQTTQSCRFTAAGTYNFQCSVHTTAMTGSVTVTAPQPTPAPTASTGAPTPHPTITTSHAPSAAPTHSQPPPSTAPTSPAAVSSQPAAAPSPSAAPAAAAPSPSSPEVALNQPGGQPASSHPAPASPSSGPGTALVFGGIALLAVAGGAAGGFALWRKRGA